MMCVFHYIELAVIFGIMVSRARLEERAGEWLNVFDTVKIDSHSIFREDVQVAHESEFTCSNVSLELA
jgi:hypothetical protein